MESKRRLILTGEKLDALDEAELTTLTGIIGRFGLSSEVETIELDTDNKLGVVNFDDFESFALNNDKYPSDLTNRVHCLILGNCVRGHVFDIGEVRRKGLSLELIDVQREGDKPLWLLDLDKLKAVLDAKILREAVPGFGPKSVELLKDYIQTKLTAAA